MKQRMETPICDFVREYVEKDPLRLHMPGHKGFGETEAFDLTEVAGADSLYEAAGIIKKSEENASKLFDAHTFYSTEGSSLCVRAMLALCKQAALQRGVKNPWILAGRNAHKSFLSGAMLLDLEVRWLWPTGANYLSCPVTEQDLEAALSSADEKPVAVYLTNPDYLGNLIDLAPLANICHKHGVLLAVDNAHGAYLKFLTPSLHPMDLGADLCCDSAHKTLPVLTGGAYLHLAKRHRELASCAKEMLALFGSTSPSYLILQSLDSVNALLSENYREQLADFLALAEKTKCRLQKNGFVFTGQEPLKFTVKTKYYGYTGNEVADFLVKRDIVSEFADPDHLVLMLTPQIGKEGLARLEAALLSLPKREKIHSVPPKLSAPPVRMTPKEAFFAPKVSCPVEEAVGRVLSSVLLSCPPAVPVLVCGEEVTESALAVFRYYGVTCLWVVKES